MPELVTGLSPTGAGPQSEAVDFQTYPALVIMILRMAPKTSNASITFAKRQVVKW